MSGATYQRAYEARRKERDPEGWRAYRRPIEARYRQHNREKHNARAWLYRALQAGRITRPEHCSRCEASCRPEAHHPDYAQPLDVVWLCSGCHAKETWAD